jgi:selenocysteine lyase/cysteine desulfurase
MTKQAAYSAFLSAFPEYGSTSALDALRASDYSRLDAGRHAYLDYTGGGLYAEAQVREHAALLAREVCGNPHSGSLASTTTTRLVEDTRAAVLRYFNGSADYSAVFTQNATAALKLIGESYPFAPGGRYLLTVDNHNSVNGIREFARAKGAGVTYVPITTPDLRIDRGALETELAISDRSHPNLFAFPAQSNFSGVKHPLDLIEDAQSHGWDVVLDAAAFVPTNRLDLAVHKPQFVAISFSKMFGYPSGVGCVRGSPAAR